MAAYDLIIRNGVLADPAQSAVVPGTLAVKDGKIAVMVGEDIRGETEIDAQGQIVSPGFIDVHGHIDGHPECAALALLQGVTTTVGGNCGLSPVDLEEFFKAQDQKGFLIHQAELIGHSFSLRQKAGASDPFRPANSRQIQQMIGLAEQAFADGAIGLSFGLEYAPGSSFEEILALSRVAAKYGRIVAIHTRMLSRGDLASLVEAIRIAELTRTRVLISHFVYQYSGDLLKEALDIVDKARQKGLDIWIDSGMYTAFATFIGTPVFSEKGMAEFGWQPEDLMAATGKYCGRRLNRQIYEELRTHYPYESVICFTGHESDIVQPFSRDYTMVSTDIGPTPSGATCEGHPQNTGTFPRFFRKVVRESRDLTLIGAIARCTFLPAETFGLTEKGRLTVGADADLVIWDPGRITDRADFPGIGSPDAPPEGISHVIVKGRIVVRHNRILNGVLPGKAIRIHSSVRAPFYQAG